MILTTTPTIEGRAIMEYKGSINGLDIYYEVLGENNGMLMVTASGTAVKFA
jgi:uncharacterized protein YbjQ (UPF0145 family)